MWEYLPIPDGLLLPSCNACGNRGRVVMVAPGVFVCTDCHPAHVFRARWVKEQGRPSQLDQRKALPAGGGR